MPNVQKLNVRRIPTNKINHLRTSAEPDEPPIAKQGPERFLSLIDNQYQLDLESVISKVLGTPRFGRFGRFRDYAKSLLESARRTLKVRFGEVRRVRRGKRQSDDSAEVVFGAMARRKRGGSSSRRSHPRPRGARDTNGELSATLGRTATPEATRVATQWDGGVAGLWGGLAAEIEILEISVGVRMGK